MEDMEIVCLGRSGNSYQESTKLLRTSHDLGHLVCSFVCYELSDIGNESCRTGAD